MYKYIIMKLNEILISAVAMLVIDSFYLTNLSQYFNQVFSKVQGSDLKLDIYGAILCYIILVFGLNYFIINEKKNLFDAFLLGFVIYGVYEATNYATLKNWPLSMVLIDSLWGGLLFALTTLLTYKFLKLN